MTYFLMSIKSHKVIQLLCYLWGAFNLQLSDSEKSCAQQFIPDKSQLWLDGDAYFTGYKTIEMKTYIRAHKDYSMPETSTHQVWFTDKDDREVLTPVQIINTEPKTKKYLTGDMYIYDITLDVSKIITN
eukprot:UN27512